MHRFHFQPPDDRLIGDGRLFMYGGLTEGIFKEYLGLIGGGKESLEQWERQIAAQVDIPDGASLVVINANPFTLGHRYLIDIASRRSTRVIVLVIQGRPESGGRGNHENTGIVFPFRERLEMTQRCLSDLNNVIVLPSGPFVISRDDFPAGFLSRMMGGVPAHAALDSEVIRHICNALGIRKVFAGDEPRDEMSEIHLNALRATCSEAGIDLRVAERKRLGEKYISSSLVRQDIADRKMDEVRLLVPDTVLEFL